MDDKYWKWIQEQASLIHSDGCTHAEEWKRQCCWQHDLAYYYGRNPRSAFEKGWQEADKISFVEANNQFAGCLPWYLKYRWLAVMGGGYWIWRKHRKARP